MSEEVLKLGEDEVDASVRFARGFLTKVARCLKTSTMHRMDNAAMQPPLQGLHAAVREGMEESPQLVLQLLDDNFFLNKEIIKLDFTSYEAGHMLTGLLARIGAQEIAFTGPLTADQLKAFVAGYQTYAQSANPTAMLTQKFACVSVRAIPQAELERLKPKVDAKQNLVRAYAHLGLTIGQQLEQMKAQRPVRLARVRRAIHELHDACEHHESLLLGLTRLDSFAGQARFHLAAVTALAVMMGRRLGLSRTRLSDACMSAAFHDIGLDELPPPAGEVVTPDELEALERVPLKTIVRLSEAALGGDALERIAVAWEHGQRAGAGGLGIAQLVAVPCVFDRLTRPPPPRRVTLPDEALRLLLAQAGTRFDARVVRLFISVVGLFPVGTAVRLDSGEVGYVVEAPSDAAQFAKPRVQVLKPAGPAHSLLDLAQPGEPRFITGSVDPAELAGANVMDFLLG
ncbi:MAG: hypothetical protein AMXMBFR34_07480 [Myxococcaceae bacterium]